MQKCGPITLEIVIQNPCALSIVSAMTPGCGWISCLEYSFSKIYLLHNCKINYIYTGTPPQLYGFLWLLIIMTVGYNVHSVHNCAGLTCWCFYCCSHSDWHFSLSESCSISTKATTRTNCNWTIQWYTMMSNSYLLFPKATPDWFRVSHPVIHCTSLRTGCKSQYSIN